jgi:hypothetical protein
VTPKVFCIGFHKTGTKSLAAALEQFGYRVTGPDGVRDPDIAKNVHDMAHKLVAEYDAFQDNPWPVLFREMDQRYPGSKFILTMRSPEAWIASMVGHFGSKVTPMRTWIYGVGCPEGNEALYLDRYNAHNRDVLAHFAGRPDDFLVMDLARGDGWEKLSPFLGKPVPDTPFPHANKAKEPARGSLLSRLFGR